MAKDTTAAANISSILGHYLAIPACCQGCLMASCVQTDIVFGIKAAISTIRIEMDTPWIQMPGYTDVKHK